LLMALAQAVLALTKQVHGLTVGAYDASKVIGAAERLLRLGGARAEISCLRRPAGFRNP